MFCQHYSCLYQWLMTFTSGLYKKEQSRKVQLNTACKSMGINQCEDEKQDKIQKCQTRNGLEWVWIGKRKQEKEKRWSISTQFSQARLNRVLAWTLSLCWEGLVVLNFFPCLYMLYSLDSQDYPYLYIPLVSVLITDEGIRRVAEIFGLSLIDLASVFDEVIMTLPSHIEEMNKRRTTSSECWSWAWAYYACSPINVA